MKKITLIVALMLATACSDTDTATRLLQAQGYTNIVTTGYNMFGCGQDDQFSTGFTAVSMNGTAVKGVVCSGWFKGGTIRVF